MMSCAVQAGRSNLAPTGANGSNSSSSLAGTAPRPSASVATDFLQQAMQFETDLQQPDDEAEAAGDAEESASERTAPDAAGNGHATPSAAGNAASPGTPPKLRFTPKALVSSPRVVEESNTAAVGAVPMEAAPNLPEAAEAPETTPSRPSGGKAAEEEEDEEPVTMSSPAAAAVESAELLMKRAETVPKPATELIQGGDPRESMLDQCRKRKPEKKGMIFFPEVAAALLEKSTLGPTLEGSLQVRKELDAFGNKAKVHKTFKKYHAVLRGCVLMFYTEADRKSPVIGPLFIPTYAVKLEYVKKKGEMLRVESVQGTFILQATATGQLDQWKQQLSTPASLVLDCPHYISSEAKDDLERFVEHAAHHVPAAQSVRVPVTLLGLQGSGKTTFIRALTTQVSCGGGDPGRGWVRAEHETARGGTGRSPNGMNQGASRGPPEPTSGCRQVELAYSNSLTLQLSDVGGDAFDWPKYCSPPPYAIVYVVDRCVQLRIELWGVGR
jgi:hypothetical protein